MSAMPLVSFDLHKLGWKAFEDLVVCIYRDVMGQTFQSFADGADGGRDGAFHGEWSPLGGEKMSGSFTVQCKHTSKPGKSLPGSIITEELPKVARLASQGYCDNYILVTNYTISAKMAKQAENAFVAAGAQSAKVYGAKWINATIAERPSLRRLVPRLYGLGDLTQIVTHQAYRQAREVLDSLAPDLACFVPTNAYRKCALALKEHGFVLLIGEPASGKTMIANLLALSAADEWDLQTLMLSGPEEFSQYWNPDDPGQFLWVDDAFGANQYDPVRVREWNHRLPKLKTAIHKGARVVFTSRDYIFNSAKNDLKIPSFELFEDSRVVIEVEDLTELERQMILYNHLKCGKQTIDFRKAVKPFLDNAAATPRFLPEIARRFANPKFSSDLYPSAANVSNFFEKPQKWLEDVLSSLSAADKAAIALVFIAGGRIPIPMRENKAVLRTISTMNSNIGEVKIALNSLNDSLLRRLKENGREFWEFRHPTIRDAFATLIGCNPEFMDIYLAGVGTDQMMQEVTCGDMRLEGVKIIIPPEQYGAVLTRLRAKGRTNRYFDPVRSFLAIRCSGDFLNCYYKQVEKMINLPNHILEIAHHDEGIRILRRLNADGLLPEIIREDAVKRICSKSEISYSSKFMDHNVVGDLLTPTEISEQFEKLKNEVFLNENEIIAQISSNWDGDDDPEDQFYELKNTLNVIEEQGTEEEREFVSTFLNEISDAISEMEKNRPEATEYENLEAEETSVETVPSARSVFEDVDE
jgi:hypothetical protein